MSFLPDLLLLHKLGIGTIVDYVATKNRGCEGGVDFFGIDITKLAIEDELVALGAQVNCGLLAQENESEYVTVLP